MLGRRSKIVPSQAGRRGYRRRRAGGHMSPQVRQTWHALLLQSFQALSADHMALDNTNSHGGKSPKAT